MIESHYIKIRQNSSMNFSLIWFALNINDILIKQMDIVEFGNINKTTRNSSEMKDFDDANELAKAALTSGTNAAVIQKNV